MGGGVFEKLARPLAEGAEKFIGGRFDYLMNKEWGPMATDMFFSMGHIFKTHPSFPPIKEMTLNGIQERARAAQQELKPIENFYAAANKDPSIARGYNYRTASVSQIHASLPQGPLKNGLAGHALDPTTSRMTLDELDSHIHSVANTMGREVAYGPNGINLAATLYPLLTSRNPTDKTLAEALLGNLAIIFKDNKPLKEGVEQSGIKADVEKFTRSQLKAYYSPQQAKAFHMNVSPEYDTGKFTKQFGRHVEPLMHKYAMTVLAPFIAIAHLADFAKLPSTVPARALWEQFTQIGANKPANLEALKVASGIFMHSKHAILHHDFQYRTGLIARGTGQPWIGAAINKFFHNPGFHNLRILQLSTFGSAAYHSAQLWAHQATRGDKAAISALQDLNLDVQGIISRGGQLTNEELEKAIWNFTNNRLFIDDPLHRAKLAGSSPFFRVATMFHGYITREGKFLGHELLRLAKSGDTLGFAQFAGTLGIVFPLVAPVLESLGVLARTASPTEAEDRLKTDYTKLSGQEGAGEAIETYALMLGHIGGMGVFTNYVHAASNHQLANAFLGPAPGVAVGLVQDLFPKPSEATGERNYTPLERDALHYTIPIVGNWIQHHFVEKGQGTRRARTSHRGGRR